jgi:6-phosphogluconolactonase
MSAKEFFFSNREDLVSALVDRIAELLSQAIAERGQASFLVSGGSSPRAVYEALAERDLDWSKVVVALVDERWVPFEHAASNEAFIRKHLLRTNAAAASFVVMKTDDSTAALGLATCEARYAALPGDADVCLLGMGSDGHTASLFPHAKGLDLAMSLATTARCAVIHAHASEVTGAHTERMTLTRAYLARAKKRILLISGPEKRDVYNAVKANHDSSATPVSAFLQTELDVYWAP